MDRKFKVGDEVIGNELASKKYTITKSSYIGTVTKVLPTNICPAIGVHIIELNDKYLVCEECFDLYEPKREGEIRIMVDEKDNNKIIARDLITGKKAEATCNPKDEWNFNKGAKLAFDRLMEPEKPKEEKGWTGKVVCICNTYYDNINWHNTNFIVGKVYEVKNGSIFGEQKREYNGINFIKNPEQLNWDEKHNDNRPYFCKFIEYKGGAEE